MSHDQLVESCRRFQEYPRNLVDAGLTYPSILREYETQLSNKASKLFCAEAQAATELFHYDDAQNAFLVDISASLSQIQQLLQCAPGQIQKKKPCTFIFVGAPTSRDALYISHDMMRWVLSIFQVLPSFLEFVFPFGEQLYALDFQFSGFREETRLEPDFLGQSFPRLSHSRQTLQMCYNLKTVEPKPTLQWPWSFRQTAIFHAFDVHDGEASWIVIKANNIIRDRLKDISEEHLRKHSSMYRSVSQMFAHTLACHTVVVQWSGENWRWYINHVEGQVDALKRRAVVHKVTPFLPQESSSDGPEPTAQSMFPPMRPSWTLRSAMSRINSAFSQRRTNDNPPTPIPLDNVIGSIGLEEPPNLPPGYEHQNQEETLEGDETLYKMSELQDAQYLDSKVYEAILVLKSNVRILSHLETHYEHLPTHQGLDRSLANSMQAHISHFLQRARLVRNDLEIHLDRLETISKLITEYKNLLYGIVGYQSTQANKMFAKEAQCSAKRMEEMTKEMQKLTLKTTLETVLMRIITVITMFFLPATFVSTLMSTDIVHFDGQDHNIASGSTSLGAVKLFVCLSFSLMLVTFAAGFALYGWARFEKSEMESGC